MVGTMVSQYSNRSGWKNSLDQLMAHQEEKHVTGSA
jgi:hypothetical protein